MTAEPIVEQRTQRTQRRARLAVTALFLTNGAIYSNLLARYPQLKQDLGLTNTELGAAIAAFPLGALLAGLAGGALVNRFRSSRVAVAGTLITAVALVVAASAPAWIVLAAAFFVAGAMDAIVDVAQNAHGLRVQRLYGRSIFNAFHASWSSGAVLGGLMGAAAAGLELGITTHLAISGALFSGVALVLYHFLLPGPEGAERENVMLPLAPGVPAPHQVSGGSTSPVAGHGPAPGHEAAGAVDNGRAGVPTVAAAEPSSGHAVPWGLVRVLLALGTIAAAAAVVEDAGASWGAVYLAGSLGAAPAVAGLANVCLQGTQFVGRVTGDRLVDHFGQRRVAQAGATITAAGMGLALLVPTTATTLIGFGAAGLGIATLIPAAMHAADELPGLKPGTGLTVVSWLLRIGFLLSPPVVGVVADALSLRFGLVVVPLAGVSVLLLSRRLAVRKTGASTA